MECSLLRLGVYILDLIKKENTIAFHASIRHSFVKCYCQVIKFPGKKIEMKASIIRSRCTA